MNDKRQVSKSKDFFCDEGSGYDGVFGIASDKQTLVPKLWASFCLLCAENG